MNQTFAAHCKAVAKDFLRTVIIIDDQASVFEKNKSRSPEIEKHESAQSSVISIKKTAGAVLGIEIAKIATKAETADSLFDEVVDHALDAQSITNAFFIHGVIAGLFKPVPSDLVNEATTKSTIANAVQIAAKCDAVIIDWLLNGKDATLAKGIIGQLVKSDYNSGGRLRTIVVYTAEKNLKDRCDELLTYLSQQDIKLSLTLAGVQFIKDGDYTISAPNLRIAFYGKGNDRLGISDDRTKREDELPDVLVNEFFFHANGLLPSFALKSVAAIRDNTHHLLTRFPAKLDGAYLAHRVLIPDAEDAEPFMLENFVSIVKNTLSLEQVDRKTLGREAMVALATDNNKNIISGKFWEKDIVINYSDLMPILLANGKSLECLFREKTNKTAKKLSDADFFKVASCLAGDDQNLHDFSVLCSFRRSHSDIGWESPEHVPYLTQGTLLAKIIENNEKVVIYEYLLCITPKCDCVRIFNTDGSPATRDFSFSILDESNDKYHIVVKHDGKHKTLKARGKFHEMRHITFSADSEARRVISQFDKETKNFIFKLGEAKYLWIGDLKDLQTQNRVSKLVENLNRVGFDEFEGLRIKGS